MKRPNLLYVFPDQFRLMSLGIWQNPTYSAHLSGRPDPVTTPNLDTFALTATSYTNAVSNCPVCSPHRGSLMTGLYPNKSGVPLNCNSDRLCSDLPQSQTCFTDILSQAGYHIGYIGKWHLDLPTANDPESPGRFVDAYFVEGEQPAWDSYTEPKRRHGIDYWYGYGTFDQHTNPHYYDSHGKRYEPKVWSAEHEADKAIEYITNQSGVRDDSHPFALFVSMNPPHSPYNSLKDCREADLALYQDKGTNSLLVRENADLELEKAKSAPYYFANVSGVDKEFGRIVDALKQTGEWENTLVVFTSDHGETLCSHGLEDAKNCIYNESFQVPFLVKSPQQNEADIATQFISSPDIMPSILSKLGLSDQVPNTVQGEARFEASKNGYALYFRNLDGEKDHLGKVIDYFPQSRGIKTERYTLALEVSPEYQLTKTRLFDDQSDPYQRHPLELDVQNPAFQSLLRQLAQGLTRIEDPWYQHQVLSHLIPYNEVK
ncbi:sulfatase [Vibrio mexicanus]|uniref:sulfatase family protein n=1 Tax=Vibrio mexicanus TaxID=1004326 RepID=UPI00063C7B1B|nr:sulfatase [Vibrio mexicanus]